MPKANNKLIAFSPFYAEITKFITQLNVLYSENILSICTNKVDLQKKLNKLLGEPAKEHKIKRSIAGSTWNISLDDKTKIQKVILKANIYDM